MRNFIAQAITKNSSRDGGMFGYATDCPRPAIRMMQTVAEVLSDDIDGCYGHFFAV